MPVGGVTTRPVLDTDRFGYGDRVRVPGEDPEEMRPTLPGLAAGFAWACVGKDATKEDGGPWVYWKVVYEGDLAREDRSGTLSAIEAFSADRDRAITRTTVRDGEELPPPKSGFEWRLLHRWSDVHKSEYGLYPKSDRPTAVRKPKLPKVNPNNTRHNAVMNSINNMRRMDEEAITTRLIRDGEPLPSAKPGYEWRMMRHWSDTRNAEYGLFKVS